MGIFSVLFVFSLASIYGSAQIFNLGRRRAIFDRFDGSCSIRNIPIVFSHEGLRTEGNKLWMNSTITAKEDILSTDLKMVIHLQRCTSKENPDTCENFRDLVVDNYCALLMSDSSSWDTINSGFKPKWKCPIKKGIYRSTDGVIDVSAFLMFAIGESYWKAKAFLQEKRTNRIIFCVQAEFHVSTMSGN